MKITYWSKQTLQYSTPFTNSWFKNGYETLRGIGCAASGKWLHQKLRLSPLRHPLDTGIKPKAIKIFFDCEGRHLPSKAVNRMASWKEFGYSVTHQLAHLSSRQLMWETKFSSFQPVKLLSAIKHSLILLATWWQEPTHWKRPWCWGRLKVGEGDDRGWDGWMASPTQWTWVLVGSRSWWWTRKPGILQSMELQGVRHNWAELNWNTAKGIWKEKWKFKLCCDSQTTLVVEFRKRKLCPVGIMLLGGPTPGSIPNTKLYLSQNSQVWAQKGGRVMLSSITRGPLMGEGEGVEGWKQSPFKAYPEALEWTQISTSFSTFWHFIAQWKRIWGFLKTQYKLCLESKPCWKSHISESQYLWKARVDSKLWPLSWMYQWYQDLHPPKSLGYQAWEAYLLGLGTVLSPSSRKIREGNNCH